MTNELIDDDIRYLRKWLNEENTSPVDRVALATVLHEVVDLRDRMGGSEGLHRINAHKIKFLKDQLAAAQAEVAHWKNNHETEVRLRDKQLAEAQNRIEQLEASVYGLYELEAERDRLRFALENCRLLAARHRKEDWALLILGFCAEGGVVGSVTR